MSQLWVVLPQASGMGRQKWQALAEVSFSGLATWCHPQPVRRSAHGSSALIWQGGLQTAIRAGGLAYISSHLSVLSLPTSFLSSLLFLLTHLLPLQLSATSRTGTSFAAASSSGWKLRLSQTAGFPRAATTAKSWTSISRQAEQRLPQRPESTSCPVTAKQLPCHPTQEALVCDGPVELGAREVWCVCPTA